ncbi:MAG: single-stranded-DNA-specific exonuclease RecJ [Candidatus Paceibacterota bacterium]|jgi:single-stranded-DNA-specific exonuclease
MANKKWLKRKSLTKKTEAALADFSPLKRQLLFSRGIESAVEAGKYLNPSYDRDLNDPFLMMDIETAARRIIDAIYRKEKIIIFGDYDADGIPGALVIESFLKRIGYNDFAVYIPDRHLEAHGLTIKAVETFVKEKAGLIITVDCGITNIEAVDKANELGLDVIITDHHLTQVKIPQALAVVDAKREDDKYPFKMLSGCAVAFKLVQVILGIERFNIPEGWEKWLLDLVAISTISDMVPLEGENRVLAHFGLKVLKKTRRLGLQTLLGMLKIRPAYVSEDDIGFMIGPHLNSAGRMSQASQAYYLLRTDDEIEAVTIAKHLVEKNKERRTLVDFILKETESLLVNKKLSPVLVIGNPRWGLGVLGLAANRLLEKYERPVFLWSRNSNGEIKGSCRSDGTVDLVELMNKAGGKKYFKAFGGHAVAAGYSLVEGKEKELEKKLNDAYKKIKIQKVKTDIEIDAELTLDDITWQTYDEVEVFGPFGVGNPKPVFLLKGVLLDSVKTFGNGGIHLELGFKNRQDGQISAIGFFTCPPTLVKEEFDSKKGHYFEGVNLTPGERLDILVNLEKSFFKIKPELRLRLVDIKRAG